MIKAVIFDFDGVLVESADIKTKAFAKLFEREPAQANRAIVEYHLQNAGVSRFEKFKYIYENILKRHLSENEFDGLCERFSGIVTEEVVKAPYVKGADDFLREHNDEFAFFITSGTPASEIADIVKRRSMLRYFKGVYGSPKKKSEMVRDIIAENRFNPPELVYVGDAMSDYEAASVNGVRFIARINDNADIFRGVDCIRVNDLSGFKDVLERIDLSRQG